MIGTLLIRDSSMVDKQKPSEKGNVFIGLGLAAASFGLLWWTRTLTQYGDSLNYLLAARSGQDLFHPHHLLYNAIVRVFYLALRAVDRGIDVITAAQLHNVLWAVVAVMAVYFIVRRISGARGVAVLAAAGLLVAQGFWEYATQTQIYVPALACLAVTVLLIVRRRGNHFRFGDALGAGLVFALAVFYHQTNVLFAIPLAVRLLGLYGRAAWKSLAIVLAAAGLIVGSAYIAAYAIDGGSWKDAGFFRFVVAYTSHPYPSWGEWRNVTLHGAGHVLHSQLLNIVPVSSKFKYPETAFFVILLAAFILLSFGRWKKRSAWAGWPAFLLVWLTVHFAFFLWWSPDEKNMFTISLLPLVLLAANGLDALAARTASRRLRGIGAAALAALIPAAAAANYLGLVGPLRATRGAEFEEARRLDACVPAQDYILTRWGIQQNLAFHFNRRLLLEADIAPLVFCRNQDLPRKYEAVSAAPVTISMDFLDPGVTPFPFNGYERPDAWKRYLGWLLGFKSGGEGSSASCRSFETLACGGVAYLRIALDRIQLAGWTDLLDRLDGLFDVRFGKRGLFREWRRLAGNKASFP